MFRVVLIHFSLIPFFYIRKFGCECFLAEGIPHIFFIRQQVQDGGLLPIGPAVCCSETLLCHLFCDPCQTTSAQVGVEDPSHLLRFRWNDLQIFAVYQSVSKRRFAGDELAALHPPLVAETLVLGGGDGLLLGQCARDAHHQFGGERLRVDIFFFEVDRHAQGHQLPQDGKAVLCIPGEAGNGLHQHFVDPALPAIGEHTVEVLPLVHPSAGQALVRIDVHQLPALMIADFRSVFADLRGVGMKLVRGIGADPAVCRHP